MIKSNEILDMIKDKVFDYVSPYGIYANKMYSNTSNYNDNSSNYKSNTSLNNFANGNNFQTIPKKVEINAIKGLTKGIQKVSIDASKVVIGAKVNHPKFGGGVIVDTKEFHKNSCVTIDFEMFGKKSLSLDYAPISFIE